MRSCTVRREELAISDLFRIDDLERHARTLSESIEFVQELSRIARANLRVAAPKSHGSFEVTAAKERYVSLDNSKRGLVVAARAAHKRQ